MFVALKKLKSLLSLGGSGGGLASVATDATLTGDGTVGDPLSVVGGGGLAVVSTSATSFSPGSGDDVIKCDTTANDVEIDLPPAATTRQISIKKMATANKVRLNPSGAELIEGAAEFDFFDRNEAFTIVSDGTGWIIV